MKIIDLFQEKRELQIQILMLKNSIEQSTMPTMEQLIQPPPSEIRRIEKGKINIDILICDTSKRPQTWNYPINPQDKIRRAFIKFEPYQFIRDTYPLSDQDHPR